MRPKLLILGGTTEAAELARRVHGDFGAVVEVISSLAGRMVTVPDLPGRMRVGGFGGPDGLADYLRGERIKAVIDATHPFADRISTHAHEACRKHGVPLSMLERAPWRQEPQDKWIFAANMPDAARQLPSLGKRAFLTIGRMELDSFKQVPDVWCLVRLIDPPAEPLPESWLVVQGRPPFDVEGETRLIQEHRIDLLVSKASGGKATFAKIEAARSLGIPVLLVQRPASTKAMAHETIDAAADWITRTLFAPP